MMSRSSGGSREQALLARTAALRESMSSLALEVARVYDALAVTGELIAQRDPSRSDELQTRAAAARRYAEQERETARHYTADHCGLVALEGN